MQRRERTLQIGLPQLLRRIRAVRHAGAIFLGAELVRLGNLRNAVRDPAFLLCARLRVRRRGCRSQRENNQQPAHLAALQHLAGVGDGLLEDFLVMRAEQPELADDEGWRALEAEAVRLCVMALENRLDLALVLLQILLRTRHVDSGGSEYLIRARFGHARRARHQRIVSLHVFSLSARGEHKLR